MYQDLFDEFLRSHDTLRVYAGKRLIFGSGEGRLLPWLKYLGQSGPRRRPVICDKVMGNAAALLAVKAGCREVYSPLGSQLAIRTLDKYGIKHHIAKTIPYIQKGDGEEICPMEALSIDKGPEEFYEAVKDIIK
ncbi:MAG: DUF1893 domain-containing protein [Chloroflexota bacterium]